jgi:MATE family multidrug resistance protein
LNSFFRGVGDMRTPLAIGVVANLANVVGDYALVFGHFGAPRLGVAGAALATALSQLLYAALLIAAVSRRSVVAAFDTRPRAPERTSLVRLARTGLPIGGQWVFDAASFAVFTLILASLGAASVAASHAFIMLVNVSFMIALGISGATQTLTGRGIGVGEPERAVAALKNGLRIALCVSATLALALLLAPRPLLRIFTDDAHVLALGTSVLKLGAIFQLLDAVHIVAIGALRGAGDTRWPFLWQSALAWGVFVPLAWLLGVRLGHGLTGAYVGGTLYVALLAAGLLWRFASGHWRHVRI